MSAANNTSNKIITVSLILSEIHFQPLKLNHKLMFGFNRNLVHVTRPLYQRIQSLIFSPYQSTGSKTRGILVLNSFSPNDLESV